MSSAMLKPAPDFAVEGTRRLQKGCIRTHEWTGKPESAQVIVASLSIGQHRNMVLGHLNVEPLTANTLTNEEDVPGAITPHQEKALGNDGSVTTLKLEGMGQLAIRLGRHALRSGDEIDKNGHVVGGQGKEMEHLVGLVQGVRAARIVSGAGEILGNGASAVGTPAFLNCSPRDIGSLGESHLIAVFLGVTNVFDRMLYLSVIRRGGRGGSSIARLANEERCNFRQKIFSKRRCLVIAAESLKESKIGKTLRERRGAMPTAFWSKHAPNACGGTSSLQGATFQKRFCTALQWPLSNRTVRTVLQCRSLPLSQVKRTWLGSQLRWPPIQSGRGPRGVINQPSAADVNYSTPQSRK